MSAEQEHHSKPCASWSGQSQAREMKKYQKTWVGQQNVSGRSLQPVPVGQHEIAESRDALVTQELQGPRPREH